MFTQHSFLDIILNPDFFITSVSLSLCLCLSLSRLIVPIGSHMKPDAYVGR